MYAVARKPRGVTVFPQIRKDPHSCAFNSWSWVDSAATVNANEWTHVAMTFDGTTITMYVNGEQVATSTAWQGKLNECDDTFAVPTTPFETDLPSFVRQPVTRFKFSSNQRN